MFKNILIIVVLVCKIIIFEWQKVCFVKKIALRDSRKGKG